MSTSTVGTNGTVRFFIGTVSALDNTGLATIVFPAEFPVIVGDNQFTQAAGHPRGRIGKRELQKNDSVLCWTLKHDAAMHRFPSVQKHGLAYAQGDLQATLATLVATYLASGDQVTPFLAGLFDLVGPALYSGACFPDQARQAKALAKAQGAPDKPTFYSGEIRKCWPGDQVAEAQLTTQFTVDDQHLFSTALLKPQGCFARAFELKNVAEAIQTADAGKGRYPMIIGFDPMVAGSDPVMYQWCFAAPTRDLRVPVMILIATFLAQKAPSEFLTAVYNYVAAPLYNGELDPVYGKDKGARGNGSGAGAVLTASQPPAEMPATEDAQTLGPGQLVGQAVTAELVELTGSAAPTSMPEEVVNFGEITELAGLPEVFKPLATKTFGEVYARSQDRDVAIATTLAALKEEGVKPGRKAGTWTLSAAAKQAVAQAEKVEA